MYNQLTCGFAIRENYKEILKKMPEAVRNRLNPIILVIWPPKTPAPQGGGLWKSWVKLLIRMEMPGPDPRLNSPG